VAQLGADVDQLDSLAQRFDAVSNEIEGMVNQLTSQIEGAWWQGTDADRFRGDWNGQYRGQLQAVCARLNETAQAVRAQANQQRATSGN